MQPQEFRFELIEVSEDKIQEENKKQERTGALAFETVEETRERISKTKKAHHKRLDAWMNHPDERVIQQLVKEEKNGRVLPWTGGHQKTLVMRGLADAKRENVLWTPVLDMVATTSGRVDNETWIRNVYDKDFPKVSDVLKPVEDWLIKQEDFSLVRPLYENFKSTPLRRRIAWLYPGILPSDVFQDLLKDEATRNLLAARKNISSSQLQEILQESKDLVGRTCKPETTYYKHGRRVKQEVEPEKKALRTTVENSANLFESLSKGQHVLPESFKGEIWAILQKPARQEHKRAWADHEEVQAAAQTCMAYLGHQFDVDIMIEALKIDKKGRSWGHRQGKFDATLVTHPNITLERARDIWAYVSKADSRALLVQKYGTDKTLWEQVFRIEKEPSVFWALLKTSTSVQKSRIYKRFLKSLKMERESDRRLTGEFARWRLYPIMFNDKDRVDYPIWVKTALYDLYSEDSEEVIRLISFFSKDIEFLRYVASRTSFPTARKTLAKIPEARQDAEIREVLRSSSFAPVVMEFAKEALAKRDFDEFQELVAVVGHKIPDETLELLVGAGDEVLVKISGKALQGIFSGGSRDSKLKAMELLGRMRGESTNREGEARSR